jgi:general nucleoside transport system permease protein
MILQQLFELFKTPGLYQTALEAAILLLLPALGGTISERSGVTNIAMEGLMLIGAFVAVDVALAWHNAWLATIAAMIAGGLLALLHAVVSIRFKADQIISGFGINIFAFGLTAFLAATVFGPLGAGHVEESARLPYIKLPPQVEQIPVLGFLVQVFLEQNIIVYIAIVILIAMQIMLFRTRLGLRIRAVGEHPQAADTAGINVYALRYGAVIMSGVLSGLAGAFLSIGVGDTFIDGMTNGRGYIALAAMIFGKWTPIGAFIGCLIFGLGTSIAASNSTLSISQYVLEMVPYILTLVVLAGLVGRSVAPAADGIPYEPGGE